MYFIRVRSHNVNQADVEKVSPYLMFIYISLSFSLSCLVLFSSVIKFSDYLSFSLSLSLVSYSGWLSFSSVCSASSVRTYCVETRAICWCWLSLTRACSFSYTLYPLFHFRPFSLSLWECFHIEAPEWFPSSIGIWIKLNLQSLQSVPQTL